MGFGKKERQCDELWGQFPYDMYWRWSPAALHTAGLLEAKECVRFQFLKEHQKEYNIQKACKILRISRSGFYDYLKRRKSNRAIENEALTEMIEDIFHEHQGWYGARCIQKVLEQQNVHVNPKRVSKLMSEHGLIAKGSRRFYRYQANKTAYSVFRLCVSDMAFA